MLRAEIGTEAFWVGIREYYRRYRDSNALTEDLQAVMEEVSGQDLGTFFSQWTYGSGQPHLTGDWSYDEATSQVTVRLTQTQYQPFNFPLDIGITLVSGEKLVQRVQVSEASHDFSFDVADAPRTVELDPNTWLLFTSEFE